MEQAAGISARIKKLFDENGLTAYAASQKLGYSRPSKLYKLLSGEVNPGYETLTEFLTTWPELSAEWLIRGVGPMLLPSAAMAAPAAATLAGEAPSLPARAVTSGRVLAVTVDRYGNENILHIPARAQAGYSHSYDEPAYLSDLRTYSLPMFTSGTFRSFEVEGDSMAPTIGHRDVVVCQFVERLDLLAPGHVYVVVLDSNVYVKRLMAAPRSRRDDLVMHSDNRAYPDHCVPAADVVEVWQVRAVISTNIPASSREATERVIEMLQALGVEQQQTRRILESIAPTDAPSA